MKHKLSALALLTAMAVGFGASGAANAGAALSTAGMARSVVASETATMAPLIQQVQYGGEGRSVDGGARNNEWRYRRDGRRYDRRDRRDRRWDRRWDRRHYNRPRSGIYFNITPPPVTRYVVPRSYGRTHGLSQAHYDWCHSRYRSYRAYDNSFQPYNGPRRVCYSPYS